MAAKNSGMRRTQQSGAPSRVENRPETDRTLIAVIFVLTLLALMIVGVVLTGTEDAMTVVFWILLWSPFLFFVAVVGSLGMSRRERERYWAYCDDALAFGREPGPELDAEALEYAYRRRWTRDNKPVQ